MTAKKRLPDFLIVGAAKAGTTAVHAYLAQHPDIFVPTKKETNFFAYKDRSVHIIGPKDSETLRLLLLKNPVTSTEAYTALFEKAEDHQRLGEASPRYLYYEHCPATICNILGEPRIISILRHPVDRAYSHFLMNRQRGLEPESCFSRAVELEPKRIEDGWSWDWHYMSLGRYAEQLRRYFALFPAKKIKVVLHEELRQEIHAVLADLFRFIGVDDSFRVDTSQRYKQASMAVANDGFLARLAFATETTWLGRTSQRLIPKTIGQQIHRRVQDFVSSRGNARDIPKLDERTRRACWDFVDDDVRDLEALLNRDLSAWRPSANSDAE